MQADRSTQRAITRLCIQCGLFLLQHGAESALVEELSTRLGLALGMDSVNRLFSNNNPVLRLGRDLGLGLVNAVPGLRRGFMRQAAGLSGDLPRLLAGQVI